MLNSNKRLKIIFAGSSKISSINLQFLLNYRDILKILAVFFNNSKKNKKLNPVEKVCRQHNLILYNNKELNYKQILSIIKNLYPNLIIVIAYGKILSEKILTIPSLGCINIHYSKLPRWIGAAPIQRAIIANDKVTGISIIKMNSELDKGKILFSSNYYIKKDDNAITLTQKLNNLAQKGLLILLSRFIKKVPILGLHQYRNYMNNYARKIDKEESELKFWLPSFYLVRYIKALLPYPTTFFFHKDIRIKVWEANAFFLNRYEENRYIPGDIIFFDEHGVKIATGLGILNITKIQLPGKRPICIKSFFNSPNNRKIFE